MTWAVARLRMRPSHFRRSAFSLIEVLVAVGLFTLASAVLVQSAYDAVRAYETVRPDSQRDQLYRFVLRSILAIQEREEMEDGDEWELPDESRADWEVEIEDGEMLNLFRVMVTIRLQGDRFSSVDDDEERRFEVMLFRPDWEMEDGAGILDDRRNALEDRRREL